MHKSVTGGAFSSQIRINRKLKLYTRTNVTFILHNIGFFILNNQKLFILPLTHKYRIKKMMYTFIQANQAKKTLMDKKKRIIVSRYFLRRRLKTYQTVRFSFKKFKKKFLQFFSLFTHNKQGVFTQGTHRQYMYQNESTEIMYKDDYRLRCNDVSYKKTEFFIKRVRFKPGYQRL